MHSELRLYEQMIGRSVSVITTYFIIIVGHETVWMTERWRFLLVPGSNLGQTFYYSEFFRGSPQQLQANVGLKRWNMPRSIPTYSFNFAHSNYIIWREITVSADAASLNNLLYPSIIHNCYLLWADPPQSVPHSLRWNGPIRKGKRIQDCREDVTS